MGKHVEYILDMPLEQAWDLNWQYWNTATGCRITSHGFAPDDSSRQIQIVKGMSFNSYGSTYMMTLFRKIDEPYRTVVSADITLSFGYGMAWMTPRGVMNKWAMHMHTTPINFAKKDIQITGIILGCALGCIFIIPLLAFIILPLT